MISLWNPTSQAFETINGDNVSPTELMLNILIELRVLSNILSVMNQDVLKDEVSAIRGDVANDTSNFVTGPSGPLS